ncbi:TPA: hypothetical protein ACSPZX_002784, partial [Aeromonas veronii]
PAHRAGFFIACNSSRRRIIRLPPSCHSLITLLKPQKDLFFCSIFAHQFNVLDTKSTECDASTFLVMSPLV